MNISLEKDLGSFKNALTMFAIFLFLAAFFTVVMVQFTLPLEKSWVLVGFGLCVLSIGFSAFYSFYSLWYIISYLFNLKNKMTVYRGDNGYVLLQYGKNTIKVTRDEIDYISAKTMFAPLKGIEPNYIELHVKGIKKPYIIRMLDRPAAAKGLVNDLIKGKITKQI